MADNRPSLRDEISPAALRRGGITVFFLIDWALKILNNTGEK
jgi:hypothetical protein